MLIRRIGAIISANAKEMSMLLGGRWLTGFGCSMAGLPSKVYMAEITPAHSRGRYMGVLNSFFYSEFSRSGADCPELTDAVGQILASGVSIPLGRLMSEYSWRTCLYLQCGPAVLNLLFVLFIAESPRWLYSRGRREEAVAILAKYHTKDGNPDSPLVKLEMEEIEAAISFEGGDREFWNFKKVFSTAGNRYRFGLCAMISCWGQLAGNGLITCKLGGCVGDI